ncbi:hypothetical protein [Mycobacterium tuberculosis]|uniref:hypothetical protein n=1 Tax=Mycobacterium tuberculosis TaxID=1773 RepID=UPI00350F50EB
MVTRNDPLIAPLRQGQVVGTLKIRLGEQPWQDWPLQALKPVPEAGWLGRAWDALRLSHPFRDRGRRAPGAASGDAAATAGRERDQVCRQPRQPGHAGSGDRDASALPRHRADAL